MAVDVPVADQITGITEEELAFLSGLALRAYRSVLADPDGDIPRLTTQRSGTRKDRDAERTRRVACLSFDLPPPVSYAGKRKGARGVQALSVYAPPRDFHTVSYRDDSQAGPPTAFAKGMLEETRRFLKKHRHELHFVLVNELALSFPTAERERLIGEWRRLAAEFDVYIVPGTYHCDEEGTNNALLCPPEIGLQPIYVRKQNSALRQREIIRTPDVREVVYCHTDFGNVGVWVCLDIYDPGLVLKLLSVTHRLNRRQRIVSTPDRELHMLMVPSFNKAHRDDLAGIAKELSRFTNTVIFVANSYTNEDGSERGNFNLAYLDGKPLTSIAGAATIQGGVADIYEFSLEEVETLQASSFGERRIFSSQFRGIVTGDVTTRRLPK